MGPGPQGLRSGNCRVGEGLLGIGIQEKGKIEGQDGDVRRHHARRKAPRGLGERTPHRQTPGQTSELGTCVAMSPAGRWWSDLRE